MIRTLLATTAVAAVLALPVIAQDASSSVESSAMDSSMSSMESSAMDSSAMSSESSMDSSMMSSEMSSEAPADSSMMSSEAPLDSSMVSSEVPMDASSMEQPTGPFDIVTGYTQIDGDSFATRIIGQPVYDGGAADANHLGDISDLIVNNNGTIAAAIIGVGGFLGIGEKQVAVAFGALERVVADDQTERFVLQTTVEELTAAPDFVVVEDNPADGTVSAPVAGDAMAPAPAEGDATATSSVAP